MPFLHRELLREKNPTKLYFHDFGYVDVFGDKDSGKPDIAAGRDYFRLILLNSSDLFTAARYLIAQVYGDNKPVAEVFGYGDFSSWPGNPTGWSFVFNGGLYVSGKNQVTCGDFDVARGREEELRRRCKNLPDFLSEWPEMPEGLLINP